MLSEVLYYIHSVNIDKILTNILFEGIEDTHNEPMDKELGEIIGKDKDTSLKHLKTCVYYLILLNHKNGLQENLRKLLYSSFSVFNIIKILFPSDHVNSTEDIYLGTLNDDLSNSIMKYMTPELPILDYMLSEIIDVQSIKEVKKYTLRLRNIYKIKTLSKTSSENICFVCNNKLVNSKKINAEGNKICHYCYYTCM